MNDLNDFPRWIRVEGHLVLVHHGQPIRVSSPTCRTNNLASKLSRRFGRQVMLGFWSAIDDGMFSAEIVAA